MTDNEIIQRYKKYEPFFGSWYIRRFVGEGGFAKVFEIVRNDFGNEYVSALKIITVSKTITEINAMRNEGMSDSEIKESVYSVVEDTVREIQLMYKLKGTKNIVGYEDHLVMEHEDGLGWDILIKMEFLTSLGAYTRNNGGRISKRDIIKLGSDICQALEVCQKYNIIHRDIKTDNIFVSANGDFKLGDFGIAKIIERKDLDLSKKGTYTYMAPEVYKGQTYTSSVDIYSLGMVLYRLMNNNRGPFLPSYPNPVSMDDRDKALMKRMSGERLPRPNQAGRSRLAEIAIKACSFRPEDRYSSPLAMRQELESILYVTEDMANDDMIMLYEDQNRERSTTSFTSRIAKTIKPAAGDKTAGEAQKKGMGKLPLIAGGIGAAVLILAVIIGVAVHSSSSKERKEEPGSSVVADTSPKPAREPTPEPTPEIVYDWRLNVLMPIELSEGENYPLETDMFLGMDVPRNQIASVTFLDTLDEMPSDARDVSEDGSGRVMAWAEKRDNGLSDIYIGGYGGVSAAEDSKFLFYDLNQAEKIQLNGNLHTEDCENLVGAFAYCSQLTSLDISSLDMSNVSDMYSMFFECKKLTHIQFGTPDTSKVTDMSFLFGNCESLLSLDVTGFNTSRVTDMSYMFQDCKSLTELDLSGFDTGRVTSMRAMFLECSSLRSLNLYGFNTSKVTDAGGMFQDCSNLIYVDVSGFDTSSMVGMNWMFGRCTNLIYVDVSRFTVTEETNVNNMFSECGNLSGLELDNFDPTLYAAMGINQAQQLQREDLPLENVTGVREIYRDDYDSAWTYQGHKSQGWHVTFVYDRAVDICLHALHFKPGLKDDTLPEYSIMWEGPTMDIAEVEEESMMILYRTGGGQLKSRLRILPKIMYVDLKEIDWAAIVGAFDDVMVSSSVVEDSAEKFTVRCEITGQWGNGSKGLLYIVQDYATDVFYMYEYLMLDSFYEGTEEMDDLLQSMRPAGLDM